MLTRQITFNVFTASAGRVLGSILALISIGFITRALGREGFGEYATVLAYLSIFTILADLGLYTIMTREISRPGSNEKYIVSNFFTLRLVAAASLLVFSALIIFLFPYSDTVKIGVVFTVLAYLFLSLSQVLMGIFQKYLVMHIAGTAEVVGRGLQLLLVWIFFLKGYGLFAYLWAIVGGSAVMFFINLYFARKIIPFSLSISLTYWKKIITTALPVAVSLVFTLLYFKIDTIMLSLMKSTEEVGIYNAAYKVLETTLFFPAMFVGIMMPILSRTAHTPAFRVIFNQTFRILTLGAIPMVVGGIILSSSIVLLIGGSEFLIAAAPLQVLFLAVGLIFYGNLGGSSIVALNLQKQGMAIYFFGMLFNITANIFVIPHYSYMGAAWTTVITELLITLLLFGLIWRRVGISPHIRGLFWIISSVVVMGGVVYFLVSPISAPTAFLKLFGIVVLGGIVYGALLLILRAVSLQELKALFRKGES